MEPYSTGYVIYHPRSFSADGRYLAADAQVAYTGGDPGEYLAVFDLASSEVVQIIEM